MNNPFSSRKSRFLLIAILVLVAIALVLVAKRQIELALGRARLAESLNDVRSLKFALDGFATDFDGQYPNEATGERVVEGGTGYRWSNDYFRQLFLSGETQSELIFWVKNSPVCSKRPPDDEISRGGQPDQEMILGPGDCHWAYVRGLSNTTHVELPLILDPFIPGTTEFDPKTWNGKVVILRVDGSAKAVRPGEIGGDPILTGEDLFSPDDPVWREYPGDPLELVVQPQPANDR